MITIKAFWQKVQTQLKVNNPVILAMVMEKKGSAPRGVGAHMLILSDGSTADTIGGGPLEYLAIQEAKQNLKNGKSIVQTFSLNNATAGEYGMVCGGHPHVVTGYADCLVLDDDCVTFHGFSF